MESIDVRPGCVDIEPKYLSRSVFRDHVFHRLKQRYENDFEDDVYGLTIEVLRIVEIVDSSIARSDAKIWVTVNFERIKFKPERGMHITYGGKVEKIIKDGVFVQHQHFTSFLINGTFSADSSTATYTFDACECVLRVGDMARDLEIVEWEYKLVEPRRLYCIVKHVHPD